tara:strand:+ start:189 stop:356 length:168 start_codon:yes stop_codon:yes gene_type:complete
VVLEQLLVLVALLAVQVHQEAVVLGVVRAVQQPQPVKVMQVALVLVAMAVVVAVK